ncbi:MAG: GlpM family protein [Methanoregulaceae archaeon]|jgi:uncharacterized membrane protein (GlpM family)|nr:GlpM family protein [Methanoregulaceae archaeon]
MSHLALLLKFIIGGVVVAGTTVLTEQIDPRYGGILATAPIITTMALIFVYTEAGTTLTRDLALNSFYFIIPTALFLAALALLMNKASFAASLGGAYAVWLISLLIINRILGVL